MIKLCQFQGKPEQKLVQVFHPGDIEGATRFFAMEKVAAPLLPEVQQFLESIHRDPRLIYLLINALGASEYFGSNINGDWFSEAALIHKGMDWGYETFYQAHLFKHHRNKLKEGHPSFGDVVLSVWHDAMKRVELIVKIDRAAAAQKGGQDIVDKCDQGIFFSTSMGCKVPFDTCVPAGTLVSTVHGQLPIEDLDVGDKVLTHTGEYLPVTDTMQRMATGLVHLSASGLLPLSLTENHPLYVLRKSEVRTCKGSANGQKLRHSFRDGQDVCFRCETRPTLNPQWVEAGEVQIGDYVGVPIQRPEVHYTIDRNRARTVGYYLGDGYVIRQKTGKKKDGDCRDMGLGFSVGHVEEKHILRLIETLESVSNGNSPNIYEAGCGRQAYIVSLYDQELCSWVLAIAGRGSHSKGLSAEVFEWDREAKLELVAGYIDTDGSFDTDSGQLRISSVNQGLLLDVQRLLLGEGIIATVCFGGSSSGFGQRTDCWYLCLAASQAQQFLGLSEKVQKFEVEHASNQSFFHGGYWWTPVKSLTEDDEEIDVYNISVQDAESYVANGQIVHNCSICLDRRQYQKALSTFNPRFHRVPGNAVLEYHRRTPIKGLSVTKEDYCEHAKFLMNKILPDGRKVYVHNDFPRFFDISMVFIGADRTSKVMSKLASINETIPSAFMPEYLGIEPEVIKEWEAELDKVAGYQYEPEKAVRHFSMEKAAGITPGQFFRVGREAAEEVADRLVFAHLRRKEIEQRKAQYRAQQMKMGEPQSLGMGSPTISSPQTVTAEESGKLASVRRKLAAIKGAEIVKDVPAMQAIPDKTLPREILNELGSQPINHSLGSLSSLGMLLKPREFQRLIIVKSGNSRLADELDRRNQVFSPTDDVERIPFGPDSIRPVLQRLLAPFIGERSAFEPVIRRRVIRITISSEPQPEHLENDSLLTKVSALYNGYLDDAIGCMMQEPSLLQHDPQIAHTIYGMQTGDLFEKEAAVDPKVLLGAIGSAYLLSRWADYQRDQAMMGAREPTGAIVNTLAKHPNVLMLLAGLGALHLQGSPLPKEILGAAKSLLMRTK